MNEELKFKANVRRNKWLGLWAAEKLGKTGAAAEDYAATLIAADLEENNADEIFKTIRADFDKAASTNPTIKSTAKPTSFTKRPSRRSRRSRRRPRRKVSAATVINLRPNHSGGGGARLFQSMPAPRRPPSGQGP